jgi:pimeloyl-ACP methyl ester carboxylesterase
MERIDVGGIALEAWIGGAGPPLLFLHGGDYFAQNRPFLDRMARRWRVIAPRHPGFGGTARPEWFRTVHDIAHLYLDLLDRLNASEVLLVGSSFGGWVALEMAVRSLERVTRLALLDTLGLKFGARDERDIADIYALPAAEAVRRTFFDLAAAPDYGSLDDAAVETVARDREATVLYGWRPFMHDPALVRWLHRVRVPTLVLWGEHDRIVAPDYGRKLCGALPDATFRQIGEAGHYPQIERPHEVADAVEAFVRGEDKS